MQQFPVMADYTRGDERARITETDEGWQLVYYRRGEPAAAYTVVKSKRAAVRALKRGGWKPV